jgi:putative membrane protein insertion efficiency factor
MKRILLFLIRCYRRFISPYTRPSCIFIPTCSVYAMQAIEKYGAAKGSYLAVKRLLRCHPFHSPANFNPYDPVP